MRRASAFVLLVAAAACKGPTEERPCRLSMDCRKDGVDGICEQSPVSESMWCSYPVDPSDCTSGRRWGLLAGDGLSGECVEAACADGQTRSCGTDEGECVTGEEMCEGDTWGECLGGVGPIEELCNDLDDDCDGVPDNGDPESGAACDTGLLGVCGDGEEHCQNGSLTCVEMTEPGEETCNGLDDDCDGTEDEGCPDYFVNVAFAGTGGGTVRSTPSGINCTGACAVSFPTGTPITLVAIPNPGSRFDGWAGACAGLMCSLTVDSAQSVTATFTDVHEWSGAFGDASADEAMAIAAAPGGDVIIAGHFSGTVNFGGTDLTSASTNPDAFVARFTVAGAHVWSRRFGGVGGEKVFGVTVDPDGDVFITGSFDTDVDFGGGLMTTQGGNDAFVVKLAGGDGSHLWDRQIGGTDLQEGTAVAAMSTGDVVVVGSFAGSADFGSGSVSAAGGNDIFMARYAATTGNYVWAQRFGDNGGDKGRGVAVDSSDNVVLVGQFGGMVDFGGGVRNSAGGVDIIVAKYTLMGGHVWSSRFGGTAYETPNAVAVDSSDNVYVTGEMQSTINFGGGDLVPNVIDVFVLRLTAGGVYSWAKRFGGGAIDGGNAIAIDGTNVYVTGVFMDTVDFGYGGVTSVGNTDIFLLGLSTANGSHLWSNTYGATLADVGRGVAATEMGNVTMVGSFSNTVDFGAGPVAASGVDMCVATYAP
jgi:hypothetical protein